MNEFIKPDERLDDLQLNNLYIIQNPDKYCFTSDAVLLANFCKSRPNLKIVDLCSGSGIIGILVYAKTKAKKVVLVELQQYLADMSMRSVKLNKLENYIDVVNKPLQNIYKEIGNGEYDVVVCNPPYKMKNASLLAKDYEISLCKHELAVTLEEIISESNKLLKYGGYFYTINKEERLTDLIVLLRKYDLEPKELKIVPSAKGSSLVLIKAKKGGKSGIRVLVP